MQVFNLINSAFCMENKENTKKIDIKQEEKDEDLPNISKLIKIFCNFAGVFESEFKNTIQELEPMAPMESIDLQELEKIRYDQLLKEKINTIVVNILTTITIKEYNNLFEKMKKITITFSSSSN